MKVSANLCSFIAVLCLVFIINVNANNEDEQQIEVSRNDQYTPLNNWTPSKLKRGMNLGRKMCQVDPRNCASLVAFNGEAKRIREDAWRNSYQPRLNWALTEKGKKYLSSLKFPEDY